MLGCVSINDKYGCLRVDISILVMGDAGDTIGYGRRTQTQELYYHHQYRVISPIAL